MLIRNKRPFAVDIVATGQRVEGGDTAEVPDEVGKSLVAQSDHWEKADGTSRPSVDDVKKDVGDDPNKARLALAVEHESGTPRKTLVTHLEGIIATREEND